MTDDQQEAFEERAAFIEQDLRASDAAVMSGDVVAMLRALNSLKEITD